jgi:hypothetical protein
MSDIITNFIAPLAPFLVPLLALWGWMELKEWREKRR